MTAKKRDMDFAVRLVRLRLNLELRNAKEVEKKEVAEEAGISVASYSQAENGIIPGEKILTRLARYYNVSEEALLKPLIYNKEREREDEGRESKDKEGLFGKTHHINKEDTPFTVITHEPKQTAETVTISALAETLHSRNLQLSEQTAEIKNLKAACAAFKEKNNDLEKRISALEAKPSENDSREDSAGDPGEKKAASSM